MDKHYQPHSIEKQCYSRWESGGCFKATPAAEGDANAGEGYSIMLPPPNVTGSLHMGHGFQHTLMDALTRYHRMLGEPTLWQPGTDHAGIATQMVVERRLAQEGKTRHDLGREAFIDEVWQWKEHSGNMISSQMRRMGSSLDWSRECFTMDEHFSEAVLDVFIQLFDEGLIYRGLKLVNWDPTFHTAVSDLEVVSTPEKGHLWYFDYPVDGEDRVLTIATTRPETMLGDTAVAVHPDDERYQSLIGKQIRLPLTDRLIPIIADVEVDREFGTGCVKITPAHDFNDNAMGKRHDLPMINIMNVDASLNDNVPEKYQGMDRFEARKQIIQDMDELNLLNKIDDHDLNVPRGDRSHDVIEPMLTQQWFVKAKPLAEPALDAVKSGKIKFVPENWTKTYYQWLENIEDWCISRQLWWGHRIPAWYDDEGNIYVGRDEQTVREKYQLDASLALTQDEDVLDTWFSSALWPFATLGWPEQTDEFKSFYPTSVLVTGFDIIFFWVARMVMMGMKFTDDIPFHEVYITGLIRDAHGQKMSKSKGNVLDPIDLIDGISLDDLVAKRTQGLMQPQMAKKIEKDTRKEYPEGIASYGTDALRFTFCALAGPGRDIRFDISRLEGYHHFCNKIWNATRYVLSRTEDFEYGTPIKDSDYSMADKWIRSRCQHVIQQCHDYFKSYRFDLLAQTLYEFTWNEFCDWYLELSKPLLMDDNVNLNQKAATQSTLLHTLETLMRCLHPLMPYITEEIWCRLDEKLNIANDNNTVMLAQYPKTNPEWIDQQAEEEIEWVKRVTVAIRNIRGEMNISPAKKISVYCHKGNATDQSRLSAHAELCNFIAKCENLSWWDNSNPLPPCATAIVGEMEVCIPLAGLVDPKEEQARLDKAMKKLQAECDKANKKLANPNYVQKAPPEVVAEERQRLSQFMHELEQLSAKKMVLANLEKEV